MYKVLYKIMKADCTSLIGLVVENENGNCLFIPKERISDYDYSNIRITKAGSIFPKDKVRDKKFTRINGNLIVEKEWNTLLETYYATLDIELPFVDAESLVKNMRTICETLNLPR